MSLLEKRKFVLRPKDQWMADIRAAKELYYPPIVIQLLEKEPDHMKRCGILRRARLGFYDEK